MVNAIPPSTGNVSLNKGVRMMQAHQGTGVTVSVKIVGDRALVNCNGFRNN